MKRLRPVQSLAHLGLTLTLALIVTTLTACKTGQQVNDRDISWIELDQMTDAMQHKKGTVVVDPRIEARYAAFHIPGAIHIPLPTANKEDERLEKAKLIIVYGTNWEDPIARAMSKKLMAFGFSSVRTFRGGIRQWIAKGLDVEPPLPPPLERPN